jgi:hypothetical protein
MRGGEEDKRETLLRKPRSRTEASGRAAGGIDDASIAFQGG